MTTFAVVILNWNGRQYLERFLPSVVHHTEAEPGCQVVVADNGSTDDSVTFVQQNFPSVRLILLPENYGFAGGYNRAIAQIDATYTVLLNSDVEVTAGWLAPLRRRLDSSKQIAAVMPKIKSLLSPDHFEYAGAAGGFIDALGYPFCRGRILKNVELDKGQYDTPREIFWASGAALAIRTEIYRKFGGLDPDFFAHMEEIDLCWRIKQAGYQIWVEPTASVYHLGGGTLPASSPQKTYLNYRNNLAMLYKNLSPQSLHITLLIRKLLDGLSALVYLSTGKPELFKAVWKAHRDYAHTKPSLRKKRADTQALRIGKVAQIYHGSILFRYLIGQKYFGTILPENPQNEPETDSYRKGLK